MRSLCSAIMPTRGRPIWAAYAVQCFLLQTYPHRELIVLDDGDDPSFPAGLHHDGIHYLQLTERLSIPEKRNKCCKFARGGMICHIDSDDWSSPDRMADQVRRLEESGKAVAGYHSMLFHVEHEQRWLKYCGDSDYALGTSLCYRRSFWESHHFRSPSDTPHWGEDNVFVRDARQAGELVTTDAGYLMYARIHADNTSIKNISGDQIEYRHVPIEAIPQHFR